MDSFGSTETDRLGKGSVLSTPASPLKGLDPKLLMPTSVPAGNEITVFRLREMPARPYGRQVISYGIACDT